VIELICTNEGTVDSRCAGKVAVARALIVVIFSALRGCIPLRSREGRDERAPSHTENLHAAWPSDQI